MLLHQMSRFVPFNMPIQLPLLANPSILVTTMDPIQPFVRNPILEVLVQAVPALVAFIALAPLPALFTQILVRLRNKFLEHHLLQLLASGISVQQQAVLHPEFPLYKTQETTGFVQQNLLILPAYLLRLFVVVKFEFK